jgi:hypothetical protein
MIFLENYIFSGMFQNSVSSQSHLTDLSANCRNFVTNMYSWGGRHVFLFIPT